jgi:hypothetical protein
VLSEEAGLCRVGDGDAGIADQGSALLNGLGKKVLVRGSMGAGVTHSMVGDPVWFTLEIPSAGSYRVEIWDSVNSGYVIADAVRVMRLQ